MLIFQPANFQTKWCAKWCGKWFMLCLQSDMPSGMSGKLVLDKWCA